MCTALEELRQEGRQEGRLEGRQEGRLEGRLEGIRVVVETCRDFGLDQEVIIKKLIKDFSLSEEDATNYVRMYW